jgi:hypothetical protein
MSSSQDATQLSSLVAESRIRVGGPACRGPPTPCGLVSVPTGTTRAASQSTPYAPSPARRIARRLRRRNFFVCRGRPDPMPATPSERAETVKGEPLAVSSSRPLTVEHVSYVPWEAPLSQQPGRQLPTHTNPADLDPTPPDPPSRAKHLSREAHKARRRADWLGTALARVPSHAKSCATCGPHLSAQRSTMTIGAARPGPR